METAFTRLLGCRVPIQLAPMSGISTPELVAAVADAGGVGMLPTPLVPAALLEKTLTELRQRTAGVFGASFLVPFLDPACLAVAARCARLVEFFYGDPDPELVRAAGAAGAVVAWQVGSAAEAAAAEAAGCGFVVVQGQEAGGHVRGEQGLAPVLQETLRAVSVPVVAAGGIATGADLAAALAAGAAGVRLGTRFVAAAESGAHEVYRRALVAARAEDTCLTEAFSVMWPNAPHRVLRSALEAAQALKDPVAGEIRMAGQTIPVPRLSVFCPSRETTGHIEAMALYAGESVERIDAVRSVAEIVSELMSGAET